MSSILYYSNYCENCKTLLQNISKIDEIKKNMHFINVDKRVKKPNGDVFIVLENSPNAAIQQSQYSKCFH